MTSFFKKIANAAWFQNTVTIAILFAGVLVGIETYADLAEKYHVPFYRSAVGEANVVAVMQAREATFGGEAVGHQDQWCFPPAFGGTHERAGTAQAVLHRVHAKLAFGHHQGRARHLAGVPEVQVVAALGLQRHLDPQLAQD
ncbi:MAG: hypothetical protein ACPGED_08190, partial [Flavobacteriales bacterium]